MPRPVLRIGPRIVRCAVSCLLVCCGPRAVRPTRPEITVGGRTRTILTLTDLEEVRDVASGPTAIWVATDDGVLVYEEGASDGPRRIARDEGLPTEDCQAIAREPDGRVLVATASGLYAIEGDRASAVAGAPGYVRATDLVIEPDGTAWLCALSGLYRRQGGSWARFGEPIHCTTLAPTPEGALWVGTTRGALLVEGDVVREHPVGGGIPEGYVRAIVPVLPGQILALVSGPSSSQLAFFDGTRWYGYTLPDANEPAIGLLLREGSDATLVTRDRAFAITPTGSGTALRALHAEDAQLRSFRAASVPEAAPADLDVARTLRAPSPLARAEAAGPSPAAPRLVATPLAAPFPRGIYRAIQSGTRAFVAVGNGGLLELPRRGERRVFRSGTLVHPEDLQVATETRGGVWVRARDGDIARWVDGRLRRLALPADLVPQAIASGPAGAYLAALASGARIVKIFTASDGSWRPLLERTLEVPVVAIPFMGVGPDGRIWLALSVEDEGGARMRGAAVLDPQSETVVYHHRGAPHGQGLPLPDEVSTMTFDGAGNAWFATLSGAVRVEAHQAIVFDETRGVRGEVVTDVASGSGRMWIAAAEGLGSYAERRFDFTQPPVVAQHRPVALATDASGHLWAAGPSGLLHHDGVEWRYLGENDGLPGALRDVEVDGAGRVWLLGADALLVLSPE